jgi:hypothetical protein
MASDYVSSNFEEQNKPVSRKTGAKHSEELTVHRVVKKNEEGRFMVR